MDSSLENRPAAPPEPKSTVWRWIAGKSQKFLSRFAINPIAPLTLIASALLFLLLSALLADEHDILKDLLRDIGIALIVAFVITVTIEQKSRAELNRTVSRFLFSTHESLFQTILGVQFPKLMFDFVRDRLMQEPIFRTGTEVHYTIRSLDQNAGTLYGFPTVILDFTSSYTVKNLTDTERRHPIRFVVDAIHSAAAVPMPKLKIDGVEISEAAMTQPDISWKDRPEQKRFEYEFTLAPHEERAVQIFHSSVKLLADSERWGSMHPCDGVRLSITHPAELSLMIDSVHPDFLVTVQENEVSYIGRIDRPLFPANGFIFWWHPREGSQPEVEVANLAQL